MNKSGNPNVKQKAFSNSSPLFPLKPTDIRIVGQHGVNE